MCRIWTWEASFARWGHKQYQAEARFGENMYGILTKPAVQTRGLRKTAGISLVYCLLAPRAYHNHDVYIGVNDGGTKDLIFGHLHSIPICSEKYVFSLTESNSFCLGYYEIETRVQCHLYTLWSTIRHSMVLTNNL